jgi:transposase-like protein
MSHGGSGEVDIAQFRDAYLRSGMKISELARRLGYMRTIPHVQKARKAIGLEPDRSGSGRVGLRKSVTYKQAVKLCDALGLDYTDVGV